MLDFLVDFPSLLLRPEPDSGREIDITFRLCIRSDSSNAPVEQLNLGPDGLRVGAKVFDVTKTELLFETVIVGVPQIAQANEWVQIRLAMPPGTLKVGTKYAFEIGYIGVAAPGRRRPRVRPLSQMRPTWGVSKVPRVRTLGWPTIRSLSTIRRLSRPRQANGKTQASVGSAV